VADYIMYIMTYDADRYRRDQASTWMVALARLAVHPASDEQDLTDRRQ
jgi:hypothetical protein